MKKLLAITLLMVLTSCTHIKDTTHHHHKTKMNCTKCPEYVKGHYDHGESCVADEDKHVANKEEFVLYHDGISYYFTSQEKLEQFKAKHQ